MITVTTPGGTATSAASFIVTVTTPLVDEVHYTYTGATSVAFDWRGTATDFRYGPTSSYGSTATASAPAVTPFSSSGPFQEVALTGLAPGTVYHYSIGGGGDHTFSTAPTGDFRFDVIGDVGSSLVTSKAPVVESEVAADNPAFVLVPGDITYANAVGQAAVDQHFNEVMAWSQSAAYMPAWGNHEWETPAADDLRNYTGRFALPNAQAATGAPSAGCCGEDWSWFDVGGVRFISYPEPYTNASWTDWRTSVGPIMAAAQADPSIRYIVTFGHRPAYSTGYHPGDATLASILDTFGSTYPKYVLNLNGHSHDYERFQPIHGVTHITAGASTTIETPWSSTDARTAFRAFHLSRLRVDVSSSGIRIDAVCGPTTTAEDITCADGTVIDTYTIGVPPVRPPVIYVDGSSASCSNLGQGTAAQPFCTISAAATWVAAGQTVQVASGNYPEDVPVSTPGTSSAPIVFTAAPGATVTLSGKANGFTVANTSWNTINGFVVTGTTSYGISVSASSNITISGNHVSYAGLPVSGSTRTGILLANTTNSLVSGNTADHNTYAGIELNGGSTGNEVRGNVTFSNAQQYQRAAPGIRIYGAPGNTIDQNVTHDNEDSGIECYTAANNTLIYGNVSYNNGDHGIDDLNCSGQRIIGNTVFHNATAGINLEGTSTGGTVANNISVDNGIGSTRTRSNIRVDAGSIAGTTVDSDLVYLSVPDTMLVWGSTSYTSLASFQLANPGQESHGIQADPKWWSSASGNFHLFAGSPAIDSADSGVSGQPSQDSEGQARVDDPATPNTGLGTRAYDDRGAFEFQPGADAPPVAVLSVTPASGTAPLVVSASASGSTDADATPISTYSFDFGDGTVVGPQAAATASHTYAAAGTFTVTVTVKDTGGLSSQTTKTVSVVADAPPVAVLSVTPASGAAPLVVSASASGSTDADATPISTYSFDFGDGTVVGPQAAATASHTYAAAGTFTVTVTVKDTGGLSSQTTKTVSVVADAPPVAVLSVTPASGAAPLVVSASASGSTDADATPISTYSFDFGDGTVVGPQAAATASHTYAAAGTFTVTVTVKDTGGLSSQTTKTVSVSSGAPPNLIGNPGFEAGLSGWNTSGSGSNVTLTQVAGGHGGGFAAKVTNTGTTNSGCTLNDSPNWVATTSAGTYTASIWVRADSAGATLNFRFREYTGSTLVNTATQTITLSTSWQQVTLSYAPTSPGSTLDLNAYLPTASGLPGTGFYADDAAITFG